MDYVALYRQWRPQTFPEVCGQPHVVRTLRNALLQGRLTHAYLFAGPRGTGKTTVARILAKAVNCVHPELPGRPCGRCQPCREIAAGSSVDVLEIDAASNRGIDEVRDLREKARYAPATCRRKVYIVDEVHMLTTEAFNALLKILEEPPAHVLFVLATTEAHRLPLTVLSRCQRFDFHRLSAADIRRRLEEVRDRHGLAVAADALDVLAARAEGSLRDALGLLDQCLTFADGEVTAAEVEALIGVAPEQMMRELTAAALDGNPAQGLRLLDRLFGEGLDPGQVARDWLSYARNLLVLQVGGEARGLVAGESGAAARFDEDARRWSREELLRLLEVLAATEADMRWSPQPRLLLEVAMLRVAPAARPAAGDMSPPARETLPAGDADPGPAHASPPPAGDVRLPAETSPPAEEALRAAAATAPPAPTVPDRELPHLWDRVLREVGRRQKSLAGLLSRHCRLEAVKEGEVLIRVGRHMEAVLRQGAYRQTLEEALRCTLKQGVNAVLIPAAGTRPGRESGRKQGHREEESGSEVAMAREGDALPGGTGGGATGPGSASSGTTAPGGDSEEEGDILRETLDMFGGQVVEIRD